MAATQTERTVNAARPVPEEGRPVAGLRAWAGRHPGQALFRVVLLVLAFLIGAAAGAVLAYGPMDGDLPAVAALGLFGGLLSSGLTLRQSLAAVRGDHLLTRRWRRALLLGYVGLALAVAALSGVQLYSSGALPPLSQDRVGNFERLWRAVRDNYPRVTGNVEWDELYSRYLPLAVSAPDDRGYFTAVADALGELGDGHTRLVEPQLDRFFALMTEIEGKAVVTVASQAARVAGLERGAVVLRVSGNTVEEAIAALPPRLLNASTAHSRRYKAFDRLLLVPPSGALDVEFETAAGERRSVTLAISPAGSGGSGGSSGAAGDTGPLVTGRRLDSGLGLIRLPTFGGGQGHDIVAEFDAALDGMMDAPGLVIDLRNNGGGDSMLADRMAGRLFDGPYVYGRDYFGARLPQRLWRGFWEYRVEPRGRVYSQPVALLINSGVASSAETFAVSLVEGRGAKSVGSPTAGSTGNPIPFQLPAGGLALYSTGDFVSSRGVRLEGRGIQPDVPVAWTLAGFRSGEDPYIAAAEQLLLGGQR